MTLDTLIAEQDGKKFKGYLSVPKSEGPVPALILMHEVYGVNSGIRQLANRFAEEGFLTLCPNMYWKYDEDAGFEYQKLGQPNSKTLERKRYEARELMFKFVEGDETKIEKGIEDVLESINLAAAFLRAHEKCDGTVASSGLCFGARNTCLAINRGADIDAGVALYPTPKIGEVFPQKKEYLDPTRFMAKPLLITIGGEDPYISQRDKSQLMGFASRNYIYTAGLSEPLTSGGGFAGDQNMVTLYYGNNGHGWNRPNSSYYDEGTSEHTIKCATEFLRKAMSTDMKANQIISGTNATEMPKSETYQPMHKL